MTSIRKKIKNGTKTILLDFMNLKQETKLLILEGLGVLLSIKDFM
jgi:hypothetical protein